ncbi:MAG: chemotaxis protein CheW [Rickettsiales bacterium]|nr:chemotaxis protein CheW [Rickettsiales bacterium]
MNTAGTHATEHHAFDADTKMYVAMRVEQQLFGIPVEQVRDVLRQQMVTPIPMAPAEIDGSLNLRGRIVTVVNVRKRLRLPVRAEHEKNMFVVVENHKGDLYSFVVDSVGEVLTVPSGAIEKIPANLNGAWKDVASGIYKMSGELLVIIDVQTMLTL